MPTSVEGSKVGESWLSTCWRFSLVITPTRRPSLQDVVREKLSTRLLPGEVSRDQFVALGLKYLADADAQAAEAPVAALAGAGEEGA